MYDELVEALRLCVKYGKAQDALENAEQAADAIEELQADKAALNGTVTNLLEQIKGLSKPRWIPVTERKPKTDDIVIVSIHDDSGDTPYDVTNVGFYLDVFPLGIWVVENERCNYVTHWMPLPQPQPQKEKPTCEDCQRECQMIGLDMEACASYKPPKEET